MKSSLSLIISREYLQRVRRKSFIITTLLVPILMIGLMVAPALIAMFSTPEAKTIAVIDDTGQIFSHLQDSDEITFESYTQPLDSARADADVEAILAIGANAVDRPNQSITLYYRGAPTLSTDSYIQSQLKDAIEELRLRAYNIENLRQILDEINVDLSYPTVRIDKEEDTGTSSMLSYFLSLLMDLMLYTFILIYGQMVMTSIIEEKNNRVLELVVSSVKPVQLMLGKICGIGLVAVTQIVIWAVLIGLMTAFVLPALMPAELLEQVQTYNAAGAVAGSDTGVDPELIQIVARLSNVGYILSLFCYMALYLIGGFMLYAAIYAAIGSAVDNIQDASQLQSIPMSLIIFGMIFSMMAAQDPSSGIGVALSYVPFTSPMVMMSRIPSGVPAWEIVVSLAVLYLSFLVMVWIAAKIYRVGIFMYGKKPSWSELIHWARQK